MSFDSVGRARRWARAVAVCGAAIVVASCSDRSSVGLIAPGHARLALAPRFATVPGAPTVPLSRVEGSLTSEGGDSTFAKATFVDGTASLEFDVRLTGDGDFVLDLVGFDSNGNEAYRAHQVYHLKPGLNDNLDPPVFAYSAPDSKVVSLHVSAGSATLDPGATTKMSVTGTGANEAAISPIRVGWTSRNPTIATVDDSGVVTAAQLAGTTYIVARTPANVADSMLITTRGAVGQVVATPPSLSLFRGATGNVTAEVRDPAGTVISDRAPTFTSGDEKIATVSATGVVTGLAIGATTITATVEGKSATVPVTVQSPVAGLDLAPKNFTLTNIEATQLLSVTITPKQGASTAGLTPTFTSSDETVATVSANGTVTSTGFGIATITAAIDGITATASVSVVTSLTVTPGTSEKLPKGTQQFTVTSGGRGPFTWQVNGVTGGNATYGTITPTGFYTAPDAVPTPASFDVCAIQDTPASKGCARMTITPVPSAGADVIIVNDLNMWDNTYGAPFPGNIQFWKNTSNFTGTGPRASQTGFMLDVSRSPHCGSYCTFGSAYSMLDSVLKSTGMTTVQVGNANPLTSIPANIKVLLLVTPSVGFSNDEINVIKQFASEGGRVIYMGEYDGYFTAQDFAIENQFLSKMGAVAHNGGQNFLCTGTTTNIAPHQITTGITLLDFACASRMDVLGPNDYALVTDPTGQAVLAAVAKVDLTPLPPGSDQTVSTAGANRKPGRTPVTTTSTNTTGVPATMVRRP